MADWRDFIGANDARQAVPTGVAQQTTQMAPGEGIAADGQKTGDWRGFLNTYERSSRGVAGETGGQWGSTENGWDTPFYKEMMKQRDERSANGTLNNWYDDSKFTGIATYDYKGERNVKFGDIYNNGQKVGNMFDPNSGYDETTAYDTLANLTLSKEERAHAYEKLDTDKSSVKKAVEERRELTGKEVAGWATQQEYQENIQQKKDGWEDGVEQAATFGAGAAGGAAVAAPLLAGGPLGWLGFGAATVGSGFAAWLNRDTIVDQAARAAVQTDMAAEEEEFSGAAPFFTGLKQWGQTSMAAISPLSNLVQGTNDAVSGTVGDDVSEWYTGERDPFLTGLGLAATLGDSLMQFASPLAATAYMGSMGATVIGGVGQLATQDMSTFDDRRGEFHAPENIGQGASAIGAVAIDAVQLGLARGVTRAAGNLNSVGGRAVDDEAAGFLNRGAARKDSPEEAAGMTFRRDADGNVTSVRNNMTLLAPSEAVQWASVRVQASNMAAKKSGAVSADDYNQMLYNAAMDIQRGTNLSKSAMINAFGEGYEEAAQAILEPVSHGWTPEFEDVAMAFAQGAAAGAGMTMGAARGRASQDNRDFTRANLNLQMSGQATYTKDEWKTLSVEEKKAAGALAPAVDAGMKDLAEKTAAYEVRQAVTFQAGLERSIDAAITTRDLELRTLNPALEGTYTISSLQSADLPNHIVQTSGATVLQMLEANQESVLTQLETLPADAPNRPELEQIAGASRAIIQRLTPEIELFEAGDVSARIRVNTVLTEAWNEGNTPAAKAVSTLLSRDPNNSDGSFQLLLPQVGETLSGPSANGLLQVSQSILKAIDGDYDGDKMRQRVMFEFASDSGKFLYRNLRLGLNLTGTGDGSTMIGERATEVEQIRQLAIAEYTTGSMSQNVKAALAAIENDLSAMLTIPGAQALIEGLITNIRNGVPDAKPRFLKALATTQPDAVTALGESGNSVLPPYSNVFLAVDQVIVSRLQRYTESEAARRTQDKLNLSTVAPITPEAGAHATVAAKQAATMGQTMQQQLAGTDPFRGPQKPHYSVYRSPVLESGTNKNIEFNELVRFYEQLSSGAQRSVKEDIFAQDEATRRALRMLHSMARETNRASDQPMRTAFFLAGVEVPYFNVDASGNLTPGSGLISAGQAALRTAVRELRRRDRNLLDSQPELAMKYDALERMTAGEAIAELFDAAPAVTLIGEAANNYAANLTFGQIKADYLNLSPLQREDYRERARSDVRYASFSHDLPYTLEEADANQISDYKIFTEALFESANGMLSLDAATGTVTGHIADRDARAQATLEAGLGDAQRALKSLSKLYRLPLADRKGNVNAANIARIIDQDPRFGRSLTQLLPANIANVVFKTLPDGRIDLPLWFFEMLNTDTKTGAMMYLRHTLLAQLNAHNAENPAEADDRMIQLVLELRQDQARLLQFEKMLFSSRDIETFLRNVNKTFATGAPYLAFHRDVAQFDSSRTKGGWSRQLPGAELRDALTKFRGSAKSLNSYAEQESDQDIMDARILAEIAAAGRDSPRFKLLQDRLDAAGKLLQGLGPAAIKIAPLAAAMGFFGGATDKGKAADLYAHLANDAARGTGFSQETGYEQVMGGLTSYDADDASGNMPAFARSDVRLMDSEGRPIVWKKLDAEQFLTMWQDPAMRPMLRAIAFPTAFEVQSDGSMTQQMLTGTSLQSLINGDLYKEAMRGSDHNSRMRYASIVDALTTKFGGTYEIQRMVADLVIARTSRVARTLEADDLEYMVDQAFDDITAAIQAAASVDTATLTGEVNKALDKLATKLPNPGGLPEGTMADIQSILQMAVEGLVTPESSQEEIEAAKKRGEAFRMFMESDALITAVKRFTISWDDVQDTVEKKQLLYQMVQDNPAYGEASVNEEVRRLRGTTAMDPSGRVPVIDGEPGSETDRKAWDAISRGIIGVWLDDVTTTASPRVPSAAAPKEIAAALIDEATGQLKRNELGRAKYWDSSWRYLVDGLLDPTSPVLQAARELRGIVNGTDNTSGGGITADLTYALSRILDPDKLGTWTSDIARQSVDAQNRIDSSGAGRQVARAGIAYAKIAAPAAATERTFLDPAAVNVAPRTYILNAEGTRALLDGAVGTTDPAGLKGNDKPDEPLIFLHGRFAESVVLSYKTSAGVQQIDLLREGTVRAGHMYQGQAAGRTAPYYATSVEEIRAAVAYAVPEDAADVTLNIAVFHPADQPADPAYANNLFFEGVVAGGNGDTHQSLISALWMSNGGINRLEQAAALKANKKGTLALKNPEVPDHAVVGALEDINDMYGTLRRKTLQLLETDLGHGLLDPSYYNAVFKDLKMRHAVRGVVDGAAVIYSADEVIAFQNQGTPIPGEQLEIVVLSPRVMRTLLAEQDTYGLRKPLLAGMTVDSEGVAPYRNSWTPLAAAVPGLLELDPAGRFVQGKLSSTRLANRTQMQQSTVKPAMDPKRVGAYRKQLEVWADRRIGPDNARMRLGGHMKSLAERALQAFQDDSGRATQFPQTALRALGLPMDMAGNIDPLAHPQLLALANAKLQETLGFNDRATGFVYSHSLERNGSRPDGVLHGMASLDWRDDRENQAFNVLHGDLVVVRLDSFPRDETERLREVTQVLRKLTSLGATVALVDIEGRGLRTYAGRELESLGYTPVAGAGSLWTPKNPEYTHQTLEARWSRLTETREVDTRNHVVAFQSAVIPVEENAALVHNIDRKDNREVALARDLAPTTGYDGYNTARTEKQRLLAKERLETIAGDPAIIDRLFGLSQTVDRDESKLSKSDKRRRDAAREQQRAELHKAFARAARNYDLKDGRPKVGTEFGPGDLVVLIGPHDQIIFYRHGFQPPSYAEVLEMFRESGGTAIYGLEQMPDATTHTGRILEWSPVNGYGLSLIEAVPLQALGNKTVLERNGMKLIGISMAGSGVELPDFGPLPQWEIDYLIHRADSVSKENFDGVVDTAQNAITFLGMDFVPAIARSLFGKEWPADVDAQQTLRRQVRDVLDSVRRHERLSVAAVDGALRLATGDFTELKSYLTPVLASKEFRDAGARTEFTDVSTAEDMVATAALVYMLSPYADPSHIMTAGGFGANVASGQAASIMMPELFTGIFDRAKMNSPLRTWFFDQMNTRLNNDPARPEVGYHLRQDWTLVIRNEDSSKNMEGYLQFSEAHSSGDNPTLAAGARDRKDSQQASRQQTLVAEQSLGARMFKAGELKKTRRHVEREGIQEIAGGKDLFQLMNGGSVRKVGTSRTRSLTPAEQLALRAGRDVRREFQQPADTSDWTAAEKADWDLIRTRIAVSLGGRDGDKGRVDSWVRIWLQRPKSANPEHMAQQGSFSFTEAKAALDAIERNLLNNLYPTYGSVIPVMAFNDVDWIYRNVEAGTTTWRLQASAKGTLAETWVDYVNVALGIMTEKGTFDAGWMGVVDGFMHTFREAGRDYVSLPLSVSEKKMMGLLDPDTNDLVLSMDPSRAEVLKGTGLVDVYNATLEDLLGGQMIEGMFHGKYPEASPIDAGYKRMGRWRKKNGIATPVYQDLSDVREHGARFVHQGTTTSSVLRIMVNMRLTMAMFNPLLAVAALPEMAARNILDDATNLLTGDGLAAMHSSYDAPTREHAKKTIKMMASNTAAKGMMYEELVTLPKLMNAGRVERWTAGMARLAGRWQDPTYGMRPETTMKRYILGAMRYIEEQGYATTMTPNQLLSLLDADPLVLKRKYPQIHKYAINGPANVRMLKPTTASLAISRAVIDPLSNNPRWWVNIPAHLGLKIPYIFLPYALNVATNITGMQGVDALAAVFLQRNPLKDSTKVGRLRAFLSGEEYSSAEHDIDWTGETLEAVNLSNAFIKGGLTHSALLGFGLMTGSLGLSGEDEEDKRRRREAQLQGAGYVYDPRDPANDFRNADALFFDNLPEWLPGAGALKEMFQVQGDPDAPGGETSMATLHWTLKQFISPLMGINRFIDNGNFMNVVWGFEDALGSMPLIDATGWDNRSKMAAELQEAAMDAEASGTPEGMAAAYEYTLNAVMSLERMLFESSFVNSLYVAADKYDRNPWTLPEIDGTGEIMRDDMNVPMPAGMMQQYLRDEADSYGAAGTVAEGRPGPSWFDGQLRTLGEKRMTLALFGSLITGFDTKDSLWRYDMVARERKVDKTPLTGEQAQALVLSMWDPDNEREVLTSAGGEAIIQGLRMGTLRPGDPALENVFLTYEQRQSIQESLLDQIMQEYIDAGLGQDQAEKLADELWYGSKTNPYATPLSDVVWGKGEYEDVIPYSPVLRYRQLNTTYVAGPDGKYWATGIGRDKLNNFFGMAPLQRYNVGDAGNLGVDGRLNSTDETAGLNTGMRNLERIDDSWANPTAEDIQAAIEEGFDKIVKQLREPNTDPYGNGGKGWTNYAKGGGYSRGSGGGGGGGYSFRLNAPTRNDPTYSRNDPYIRADNPLIRRATIRRERFSSERGRLKPWQ